jgi:hypothetical protein
MRWGPTTAKLRWRCTPEATGPVRRVLREITRA